MSERRTLIRGGTVFDPSVMTAGHPADVREGEIISAIRRDLALGDLDETLDATGMLVAPDLVDMHRHVWQTNIRGIAADWSLIEYLCKIRIRIAGAYSPEDVYLGNLLSSLEMLDSGVTTVCDHSYIVMSPKHAEAAIRGLRDSGIRAV